MSNKKSMEFTSPDWGRIRTESDGTEVWFVAADVCRALDIRNTAQALTRLDEDEKGVILNDTPGGAQMVSAVCEAGLYALVLSSRKPEAREFKRWVTHTVIPSIRKTGTYAAERPQSIEDVLILSLQEMKAVKARQDALDKRIDDVQQIVGMTSERWREDTRSVINNIAKKRGGFDFFRITNSEIYDQLERRGGVDLERRLANKKDRMKREGVAPSTINRMSRVDAISDDRKLIEIYVALVKEAAVRYGVSRTIDSIDIAVG